MKDKKIVCIFEDEDEVRQMYAEKFRLAGFRVCQAGDGLEALKIIKETQPDLIILDILMPKMDGYQFLEELKKDKSLKDIPVFVLTNLGQEYQIKEGLKKPIEKYMVKFFFTPEEVVENVRKYFSEH